MKQLNNIRFELLMDAGNGAQKAGDILIKAFAKQGAFVYIEPIIPAEISPPKRTPHSMSGVVIRLSNKEIANIGSYSNIVVVEHEILLNRRLQDKEFYKDCLIIIDQGARKRAEDAYLEVEQQCQAAGHPMINFQLSPEAEAIIKELNGNGKNMYYLGLMTRLFNVQKDIIIDLIKQTFKRLSAEKLAKNLAIFEQGLINESIPVEQTININVQAHTTEKVLLDGNTAMALGIIDAGIKLFAGYPITPASSIMHTLAKIFPHYNGVLHQAEDEISAIGTVLGSYFSGVPAITATSGPGLSLKQEFIGLSVSSEIPCIVIDVMRGGPSTGLPTRTEQTDLFAAIYGSHGDSPKVVISVANVEDCFYAPHIARYLTETLRLPVIILSDYITSVSYRVLDKLDQEKLNDISNISDKVLNHFNLNRLPKNIEMVKDNQNNPGVADQMRRVTGLNTNKQGFVEYSSDSNHLSHEIRNEKLNHVKRSLTLPEQFGDSHGELLIVGWGSSRGVIAEVITELRSQGHSVSGLHFKVVYPLPLNLETYFKQFKQVVTIEMAFADHYKKTPFATMLRSETLIDVNCLIAEAKGRPLKPEYVIEKAKPLLKETSHV